MLSEQGVTVTQYRDESHAVVRALNCGEGRPVPAKWQQQYTSGYRESHPVETDQMEIMDRLLADAMAHSLIRRHLTADQYAVLVLRYSGDEKARISALRSLLPVVGTNAGINTKAIAIGAWAGYRQVLPASTNYDATPAADSTIRTYRMLIKRSLNTIHEQAMNRVREILRAGGLTRD